MTDCDWLNPDPCLLALASSDEQRQALYKALVGQGSTNHEVQFIRDAVQRNQLTGSEAFALEIEKRIGERIVFRSRG